jgi:hypothetical protein
MHDRPAWQDTCPSYLSLALPEWLQGIIDVRNLSVRYRPELELVLKSLTWVN